MDSNGPDVKIRGNPNQIFEKYLSLARDANSSGDRVMAENYLQHAEHYYRLVNGDGSGQRPHQQQTPHQQQPAVAAQPAAEAPKDPANEPQPPTLD